ncbi:MAG: cytochrome c oxidase subunit 3 [Flavobacteriaceae bacterium]|nr:cytochrome c oxidase subunit 3 [Flavobacteriaceae bacterium]
MKVAEKSIFYPPGGILIWIVIFLELFTFGIALIAMAASAKEEPIVFHNSRLMLNTTYGTINTVLLITSGFFMAVAVQYLKKNNIKKLLLYLVLTMLGGVLFLVVKTIEYHSKLESGLDMSYNTFFSYYWMLTLFHVIHVIVGLVILSAMYFSLKKKQQINFEDFEASAAFWHMCDLIWLLLFPVIYLIF